MNMLENLLEQMIPMVEACGVYQTEARKNFSSADIQIKGKNDLVSFVDKHSEEMIVKHLQKIFPEAGFITEEGTINEKAERYNWIIDPLDGTTNFIHGLPLYCISIALVDHNIPVLGIVYESNSKELFTAIKNKGAFLNKNKIHVAQNETLDKSLIATGFPYTNFKNIDTYLQSLKTFMDRSHGVRRLGTAALDLCYVACGRFDGYYEHNLNSWDVAAGALIVQEAGGTVSDFSDGQNFVFGKEILANNTFIHREMLDIIESSNS